MTFENTVERLREDVRRETYLDISRGSEKHYDVSRMDFYAAINALRSEGYVLHYVRATQHGSGKVATVRILTTADTTYREVFRNLTRVESER